MPHQIEHFHDGPEGLRRKLNEIVDVCNAVLQARGDDSIQVQVQPGAGMTITLNAGTPASGPARPRFLFPVHVTKDSGVFTPTLTATYTVKSVYDANLRDGANKTSTLKVPKRRWPGAAAFPSNTVESGSDGIAFYDKSGNLILYSVAQEWPMVTSCTEPTGGSSG